MDHAVENGAIPLPAVLDRAGAADLLRTLTEGLREQRSVWLDAGAVETVSTPAVQVLLSAIRHHPTISVVNAERMAGAFAARGIAWTHTPQPMPQPMPQQPAPEARPLRILTIDDSRTMRDMLMLTLSAAGFEVLQAVDGRDGIDVAEREPVDIIITDINMPNLDGYGVIEHLRGQSKFDRTPILVLTTEADREKKDRARDLGATGFIVKPFNPDQLVDVIRKVAP